MDSGGHLSSRKLLGHNSSQRTHLMLLSLLFQVGNEVNEGFQPLVEALSRLSKPCELGGGRDGFFP